MQLSIQTTVNSDLVIKEADTVTFSDAPNGESTIEVTFTANYNAVPLVMVTMQSTNGSNVIAFCRDITTTGCKICIRNNYGNAVSYIVVGYAVII